MQLGGSTFKTERFLSAFRVDKRSRPVGVKEGHFCIRRCCFAEGIDLDNAWSDDFPIADDVAQPLMPWENIRRCYVDGAAG